MSKDTAIKVDNVSKTFRLPHEKSNSIKSAFINFYKRNKSYEVQEALKDVSFEIKKGEFFGIVGRNGSGKSTLLKLMAGIYTPSEGSIHANGKIIPFIELGVGFNQELTGRENVYLNGALLGFNRKEMEAMYDEIVEFAELERFMDQKLKNYSSGMQVRLAFSIAIRAEGDVLLLDEVLAVGDEAFQRKCFTYFKELKDNNKTVILVTHSMDIVEQFCSRALLIETGSITMIGDSSEVAQLYSDINVTHESGKESEIAAKPKKSSYNNGIKVEVKPQDQDGNPLTVIKPDDTLSVVTEISSKIDTDLLSFGMIIYNSQNIAVFATNTVTEKKELKLRKGEKVKLIYKIDNIFTNDIYRITAGIKNKSKTEVYFSNNNAAGFKSIGRKHSYAVASPNFTSELKK